MTARATAPHPCLCEVCTAYFRTEIEKTAGRGFDEGYRQGVRAVATLVEKDPAGFLESLDHDTRTRLFAAGCAAP